jgi:ABC-2 type transport system permease protein
MLILQLVKKDFLLAKQQVLLMLLLGVVIPLWVTWLVEYSAGVFAFIFSVIFTELLILQYVAGVEAKYPKAAALLHCAPYSRRAFVLGKYVFFLSVFAYCAAAFVAIGAALPRVGTIGPTAILAVLLCAVIIYGVYLPLQFKLGFEKTRFFFMIAIIVLTWGTALFIANISAIQIDLAFLATIPIFAVNLLLLLASAIVLYLSVTASIKIYSGKEL